MLVAVPVPLQDFCPCDPRMAPKHPELEVGHGKTWIIRVEHRDDYSLTNGQVSMGPDVPPRLLKAMSGQELD